MILKRAFVGVLLCAMLPGVALAQADALDKVTGTESWSAPASASAEDEWQEWYRARVTLRRMLRQVRIQRVVNTRLAQLLTQAAGGPNYEQVLRVIRAGARQVSDLPASRQREPLPSAADRSGSALEQDEQQGGEEDRAPASWSEVPVERLDDRGQAIDDEGDRELKKLMKER